MDYERFSVSAQQMRKLACVMVMEAIYRYATDAIIIIYVIYDIVK